MEVDDKLVWIKPTVPSSGKITPHTTTSSSFRTNGRFNQLAWADCGGIVVALWARDGTNEELYALAQSLVDICEMKRKV